MSPESVQVPSQSRHSSTALPGPGPPGSGCLGLWASVTVGWVRATVTVARPESPSPSLWLRLALTASESLWLVTGPGVLTWPCWHWHSGTDSSGRLSIHYFLVSVSESIKKLQFILHSLFCLLWLFSVFLGSLGFLGFFRQLVQLCRHQLVAIP